MGWRGGDADKGAQHVSAFFFLFLPCYATQRVSSLSSLSLKKEAFKTLCKECALGFSGSKDQMMERLERFSANRAAW
jgi:hypothetical protein